MAPPEMGLSPLVGLLQRLTILMAHPLKHALNIFDERFKVRRRNRKKSEENKIKRLYLICRRRWRLKSATDHLVPQTQIIVNQAENVVKCRADDRRSPPFQKVREFFDILPTLAPPLLE